MPNNGFGLGVVFGVNGSAVSTISGSVTSFTMEKQAEIKETTDSNNAFLGSYKGKQRKVATIKSVFINSGSAFNLPELLSTCTATNPSSGEVSGSWAVYKSSVDWKNDDFMQITSEIQQLVTATGTLP